MTDQTGAEQQSASGSRTGDVDVADPARPDTTTDVQSGGATDVASAGPDAGIDDGAAVRGGDDMNAPRGERGDTDQQRDDTDSERAESPRAEAQDSDDEARDSDEGRQATDEERQATDEERQATDEERQATDEERQKTAEEFAREHDPEQHDVTAGEEFRQEGDWTADEAGGPQVWDNEGNLVEGSTPGQPDSAPGQAESSSIGSQEVPSNDTGDEPRTSSLDEIRDGGYGVGSAATIDDGAVPLGHPVKAWEDTKTFVAPDHDKYDEAEPHVWFADEHAAQRAGFRPVD